MARPISIETANNYDYDVDRFGEGTLPPDIPKTPRNPSREPYYWETPDDTLINIVMRGIDMLEEYPLDLGNRNVRTGQRRIMKSEIEYEGQ